MTGRVTTPITAVGAGSRGAAERPAAELHELQAQCARTRAELERAPSEQTPSAQRLSTHPATLLRDANERLLLSTLEARHRAEVSERRFDGMVRKLGLDALTQLPNRLLLRDRFDQAAAGARRHGGRMAVLFVDLDRFKQINDVHGHAAGDKVLRVAAQAIVSAVRESDTVSRYGGDEFVVLLGHLVDPADALAIAEKIAAVLAHTRVEPDEAMTLSASIGMALYPDDGEDIDTLIEHADAAMYRRKRGPQARLAPGAHDPAESGDTIAGSPAQLREVNERLVMALLGARDSQQQAECAVSRQQTSLAVVAHELRNPLAAMSYAIGLLKAARVREPVVAGVHGILERQLAQMVRMVGDLMDVSRATTGKLRMECVDLDIRSLVDAAVQGALPGMQRRCQTIDTRIAAEVSHLRGDAVRLEQLLVNLLDNASKYTPDGGSIRLEVAREARDVVLTVSDNGIGISPQELPRVFEAFVQEGAATTFNGDGIGIGLMLVQHIVKAHGGSVDVRSQGRGLGSEFVVRLPLAPADHGPG